MEYKRITSKGGVNIPVKLRRSMGIEPRDAIELEVNDRNELVIRAYQARCIYCGSGCGRSHPADWFRPHSCYL